MDTSPSGTSPVRWTIATRSTPNRTAISSAMSPRTASAIDSWASYSSDSTSRPAWRAASASWPGAGVPGVTRVRPRNPTAAPSSGEASRSVSSPRIAGIEGRGPQLQDAALLGAAGHRRDHRDLVAVGEVGRAVRIRAVPGEPHRGPPRREVGMDTDQGGPRVVDRRAVGQVERDLARAGQLALDREEPDAHAHLGECPNHARSLPAGRHRPAGSWR